MTLDEVKEIERKAYMEGDSTTQKLCSELLKHLEIVRDLEDFLNRNMSMHLTT